MKHQSGRSMVEILGVLAIIGVLSVGGLAAYRYAMNKKFVNDLIYDLNLADTEIMTDGNIDPNLEIGDPIELDVFEDGHPKVVFVKAYDFVDGQIILPEEASEAEKAALDAGVLSPYWVHFDALTAAECVALFKSSYGERMPFVVALDGELFDVANLTDAEKVDFCNDAFPDEQVVIDDDVVGFNFSLISSAYAADTNSASGLGNLSEAATNVAKLAKYILWDVWGDLWDWLVKVVDKYGPVVLTEEQSVKLKKNLDGVTEKGKKLREEVEKEITEAKNNAGAAFEEAKKAAEAKAKAMKEKVEKDVKGFYLSWPDFLKVGKEGRILGIACDAGEYFDGKKCVKCPAGSDWDINGTPFRMIQKTKVDYERACFCDEETPLYDANSDRCYACDAGTYATKELKCEKCPGGSVRYDDEKAGNALAVFDFAFNDGCKCPKDSYWSDKDDKCMTCPLGSTWKKYRPKDGDIFVPGTEGVEITSTLFGSYEKAEGYACICPSGSYFDTKTSTCYSCPVGTERQKAEYFQKYSTVDFPDTFDEKTNTYCGCPIDRPYWNANADNGENLPKGACVACPPEKPFYDPERGICRTCFDVSLDERKEIFWDSDLKWYVDDEKKYERTGKCVSCPDGTALTEFGYAEGSWFGFSVGASGLIYGLERDDYPFDFVDVGGVKYGCACSEGYYFDDGALSSPTCKACDGGKYNPTNNSCDGGICTGTYANAVNNGWKEAEKAGDITVTRTEMTSNGIQYVEISSEFNGSNKEREAYRCDANSGGTVCHWSEGCFIYHGEEPTLYCEDGTFPNVGEMTLLPEGEMVASSYYSAFQTSSCDVCPSNAYWISGEAKCNAMGTFPQKMGENLAAHWGATDCKYLNARCIACGLGKTISSAADRKSAGADDCVCLEGTSTNGDGVNVTRNGGKNEVDRSECRCNFAGQYWDEEKEACVCPAPTKLLSELPEGAFGARINSSTNYESDYCVCPYEGQVWAEISSGWLGLSTTQTCICGEGYCSNEIGGECHELKDTEYRNEDGTCAPCGGSCDSGDCVLRDTREGATNPCISCYTKDSTKPYWDGDSCEPCPADKPKWAEVHADWDFTGLVTSKWQCTECPNGTVYGQTSDGTMDCVEKQTDECTDESGCGPDQFCLTEGWLSGQSDEVKDYFKNKPQNTCYEMLSEAGRACAPMGMYGCRTQFGGQYARDLCGEDEYSWYQPCLGGTYNDDSTLCPTTAWGCLQCPANKPYSYMQTISKDDCFSCPANADTLPEYGGTDETEDSSQWVYSSNGMGDCYCKTGYYAVNDNKNCCLNRKIWKNGKCVNLSCPANSEETDETEEGAFAVYHPVNSDPNYTVWCKCDDGKTWNGSACV